MYSVCSNIICGYSCVFVCTACAVMLFVAILVFLSVHCGCINVMFGYSCVFVCKAFAVMLCVAIAVCLCVKRVQ